MSSIMTHNRPATVGRPELLVDGADHEFRVFLHAFMVFSRRLDAVRSYLAQVVGVSAPQYEILSHLRENSANGGLTVREAALRLHCSGAFVTTEAGKLQRRGLLVRARDPNDARCVRLTLTAMCEKRMREVAPIQRQLNDTLFASLSAKQFQVLRDVFPRLADDGDRATALAEFQSKSAARRTAT
jgi:MarR family transcriptional regulator, organic hydroperoxide resistance regulator